jgi:hypothetical protein
MGTATDETGALRYPNGDTPAERMERLAEDIEVLAEDVHRVVDDLRRGVDGERSEHGRDASYRG